MVRRRQYGIGLYPAFWHTCPTTQMAEHAWNADTPRHTHCGMLACGGGSGGGGGGGTSNPGTAAGTYTVTVTGTSGATTATGTVTLTVQ